MLTKVKTGNLKLLLNFENKNKKNSARRRKIHEDWLSAGTNLNKRTIKGPKGWSLCSRILKHLSQKFKKLTKYRYNFTQFSSEQNKKI